MLARHACPTEKHTPHNPQGTLTYHSSRSGHPVRDYGESDPGNNPDEVPVSHRAHSGTFGGASQSQGTHIQWDVRRWSMQNSHTEQARNSNPQPWRCVWKSSRSPAYVNEILRPKKAQICRQLPLSPFLTAIPSKCVTVSHG